MVVFPLSLSDLKSWFEVSRSGKVHNRGLCLTKFLGQYDIVGSYKNNIVFFFSVNKKAHTLIELALGLPYIGGSNFYIKFT